VLSIIISDVTIILSLRVKGKRGFSLKAPNPRWKSEVISPSRVAI
jgi:hypothetical protein